ncbi:hypothetical protein Y032_0103g3540 [Ancylostoma ceylanicum]|uniref:Uncharacterized protein n=1 Tax=Ancylostoma ceylanicum TaxID=53326 RepID=A0A016TGU6_9BILA|nr:hypothetical protein Y032_0103g3540 [Ancylostoma ceylanicum]
MSFRRLAPSSDLNTRAHYIQYIATTTSGDCPHPSSSLVEGMQWIRVGTTVVIYTVLRDTVIILTRNTAGPPAFRDRLSNVLQCLNKFFPIIDLRLVALDLFSLHNFSIEGLIKVAMQHFNPEFWN